MSQVGGGDGRAVRRPRARRAGRAAVVVLLALTGGLLALAAFGALSRPVGPFQVRLSLSPSVVGRTVLAVPPLGDVRFDTHDGPVALEVRVTSVRPEAAAALVGDGDDLQRVGQDARDQLRRAVVLLLLRDTLLVLTGAGLTALVVLRGRRPALQAAGVAAVLLLATGGVVAMTASPQALTEPEYTGALAYAPTVIGDVQDVIARLDDYGQQLGRLVANVATLYDAASTLPDYRAAPGTVRLLHVSDLHLSTSAYPVIASVVKQFDVDLVVDTGDVADHGSSVEDGYVDAIAGLHVPYVYVRGNHDSAGTEAAVRRQPNAVVLDDGLPVRVAGLTVMGQADPRFTPDKRTGDDDAPREELRDVGRHLGQVVLSQGRVPDVVAVHDPLSAEPLLGQVPLVLAGHLHRRAVSVQDGTRLMVEGSTGGAGLRALEGDTPTPVEMTVLYLGTDGQLQAYDEITLGGLGLTDARIRRQVVTDASALLAPGLSSPSPSPSD